MASTSDIKNGLCINFNHDVYVIVSFQHVKPGKGAAFVRTKIKSMTTGKVLENTFSAGHKIDVVRVERRVYQYLYNDDMGYHFMNNETFDQIAIQEKMISRPGFLKEGMEVDIIFHATDERPLTLELPQYIELEVSYTEPGLRGDTATNVTKPAKLETGAEIRVPIFVNEGDLLKINSQTGEYMERVKK